MTLKEIRAGYREVLALYNGMFPSYPKERKDPELTFPEVVDLAVSRRAAKVYVKTPGKKTTEITGPCQWAGAQIWHRGEPLEGLDASMRARVTKALDLGI